MHLLRKARIAHLKTDEALTKVLNKYADFANVFLLKLAVELSKHIGINNYVIELIDDQQLSYSLIYSLGLVELEILKIYIENNLISGFIRPSKSFSGVFIFLDRKLNGSL